MAYHLTGMNAFRAALKNSLTPVEGGLKYTAQQEKQVYDVLDNLICVKVGESYKITGTRDSNGYIITTLSGTYYLTPDMGCKLV